MYDDHKLFWNTKLDREIYVHNNDLQPGKRFVNRGIHYMVIAYNFVPEYENISTITLFSKFGIDKYICLDIDYYDD